MSRKNKPSVKKIRKENNEHAVWKQRFLKKPHYSINPKTGKYEIDGATIG